MKIKKNGKVINLTESDLKKIVKRVLLGEQNRKLSEKEIARMTNGVQGLIAYDVKEGDTIHDIIKNGMGGISFYDFNPELNDHIVDFDKIYPGDVLFLLSDPRPNGGNDESGIKDWKIDIDN
jgi:hypothetical protein